MAEVDAMAVDGEDRSGKGRGPRRGFGVSGALQHEMVRTLAGAAEDAGYHTFWVNDAANGDGLAALAQVAGVTSSIRLGVGAIPLDRQGADQIAARIEELGLPVGRLTLGIGSGSGTGGLDRVRNGVTVLRTSTDATLVVAAMGPRMCRLAGEVADGVLLDWATPAYIKRVAAIVTEAAAETGRPRPWLASYVFTALGREAGVKLRAEADYYGAIPSYAAHFARMDAGPIDAVVCGDDSRALRRGIAQFDAVLDETVVRAVVPQETAVDYLVLLRAAASG